MKKYKSSWFCVFTSLLVVSLFSSNVYAVKKFSSNMRSIDDSTVQLSVWSNVYALPNDLEQMAFKLAAKATLNNGYDYFLLQNSYVSSEKSSARFSSNSSKPNIEFTTTKDGKPVDKTISHNPNDLAISFERFLVSTIIHFTNVDSSNGNQYVYRAVDVLRGTAYLEDYFDQSSNAVASAMQALRSPETIKTAAVLDSASQTVAVPAEIQQMLNATNVAFGAKNWQEVIKLSTDVINLDPANYLAYANRSGAFAELSQLDSALKDANKAILLQPSHNASYHNRGYVYALLLDNESAALDYKKACDSGISVSCQEYNNLSKPTDTRIASVKDLQLQSSAAFNKQQWNQVIDLSNQIINQDASNYLAYSSRSGAQAELGNLDAALQDVNTALTLNADYKNAYHNRGYIHSLMSDNQSAMVDYQKACNLGIDQSCKELISLSTLATNKTESATIEGNKATATVASLLAQTGSAFAQNQWNEVIRLSSDIINIDNSNYIAYSNRSGALAEEGKLELALDDANKTLQLNPEYKFAYHNRGYIHSLLDDDSSAITDYKKACSMGVEQSCTDQRRLAMLAEDEVIPQKPAKSKNTNIEGMLASSDAAFASQQWDEVVRISSEIIKLDPNNYLAYSNRSGALAEQGKLNAALKDVNKTLALNSNYKNAYHNRGYIYSLMNSRLSASIDYKKACDLGISVSCDELKNLKTIATNTSKPAAVKSQAPNPSVLILMAQTEEAFSKRQWDEVVRLASEVIKRDPINFLAYSQRSGALAKQGYLQDALRDVTESININPNYKNSYHSLGNIYSLLKDKTNASLSYKSGCDKGVSASCDEYTKLNAVADSNTP